MNIIAAVDRNWALGKDGDQLVYIPEDLIPSSSSTIPEKRARDSSQEHLATSTVLISFRLHFPTASRKLWLS